MGISLGGIILGHYLVREGESAKVEAALLVSGKVNQDLSISHPNVSQKVIAIFCHALELILQLCDWYLL